MTVTQQHLYTPATLELLYSNFTETLQDFYINCTAPQTLEQQQHQPKKKQQQ